MAHYKRTSSRSSSSEQKDKEKDILCNNCNEICFSTREGEDNLDDDIIECDTCRHWYHRKCLDRNYNKKEWELLSENKNIMFKCQSCIEEKGEKFNEIRQIRNMIEKNMEENKKFMKNLEKELYKNFDKAVEKKFKEVTTKQNLFEKKMEEAEQKSVQKDKKYEERLSKLEKQLNEKQNPQNPNQKEAESKKLETMMKEVKEAEVNIEKKIQAEVGIYLGNKEEKERKKQNLIIQRLTETEEKEEDQKKKDKEEVLKIIEITNPEMVSEIDNILKVEKNIIRLGRKKSDRPRPIRIILNDEEMKRDILKKCKNLRDSPYKHISVQDDLTREEQEKQYKLRQELRKRKEEGQKVRIYRGEIIPVDQHPGNSD